VEYEFKFFYPQRIQSLRCSDGIIYDKFVPRQYLIKNNTFGTVVRNRVYVFGLDTFERKTIVALNHELIHAILNDLIGEWASFTFDFIFKSEFFLVVRELLGQKLGNIIGVYL